MNEREVKLVEHRVTYILEHEGRFCIVENVPARVNEETGERFFSPATVERLQRTILGEEKPSRILKRLCTKIQSNSDEDHLDPIRLGVIPGHAGVDVEMI